MATEVTLPELGESVTEGTITEWLVAVGDEVSEDDPLFELSSDKIDTEVPSPASGVLKEIRVNVDETVEVGTVVAIIGEPDEESGGGGGASDEGDDSEAEADDGDTDGGQTEDTDSEEAETEQAEGSGTEKAEAEAEHATDTRAEDEAADAPESSADGQQASADEDSHADQADGGEQDQQAAGDDVEVTLPELGESVTEGTITEWLIAVGDEVNEDDPLFELSSDKIDTEVPSPASGTLKEIRVDVDETVEVGTVVAIIGSASGGGGSQQTDSGATQRDAADAEQSQDADQRSAAARQDGGEADAGGETQTESAPSKGTGGNGGVAGGDALMSPIVRRMIAEHDLDPARISGSGQGGRITRDDVQAAISGSGTVGKSEERAEPDAEQDQVSGTKGEKEPSPKAFEPGERERVEKLPRIRQRIAARMMESQANTASLTTVQEADMTRIMRLRAQVKDEFKQREGASLSPFAFLARAALLAIKRHPTVNSKVDWDAGEVLYRDYVNLGIAVDTDKGLLVPNVKNADDLTLAALARNIADVANRARAKGQLEMSDIQDGTFTITNTGSRGVLIDTPILNYPEVAILGTGAIKKRPVVASEPLGDTIAIRDMVYLCLTYDHQILDGADAARFVTDVAEVAETHEWEAELGLA